MNLFPDIPVSLLSRCSVTGPLDLAAELAAAGMQAASWQVEEMQAQLAEMTESHGYAFDDFTEAQSRAEALARSLDELDGALLDADTAAIDAGMNDDAPTFDDLRAGFKALAATVDQLREKVQSLAADARSIQDIDTAAEAAKATATRHWANRTSVQGKGARPAQSILTTQSLRFAGSARQPQAVPINPEAFPKVCSK